VPFRTPLYLGPHDVLPKNSAPFFRLSSHACPLQAPAQLIHNGSEKGEEKEKILSQVG